MPVCTIAIPVYNRAQLVRDALDSALSQQGDDLEILVIDNCSTDGTWETLQSYHDPRLRLVRNDSNVGLAGNLNRCLELARGEYIRILCSDDRLLPGCIAGELQIMRQHPNVALLVAHGWLIDAQGKRMGPVGDYLRPGLYPGKDMPGAALWALSHYGHTVFSYPSGVLMKREATRRAGEFDTRFTQCSDVHFFLKVLQHGDLAVTRRDGCEVMLHTGAITNQLMETGMYGSEWTRLAQVWADHLPSPRLLRQVTRLSAAFSVYFALQCHLAHNAPMRRAYLKAARAANLRLWEWPLALGKFWLLHLPHVYLHYRHRPIAPMQELQELVDSPVVAAASPLVDKRRPEEAAP